uniref:Dehydrogenase/reductase SDR family member 11 n=1 Tax=Ciona savignyi TaxID=51511 RepID=H2YWG8_CIOSA
VLRYESLGCLHEMFQRQAKATPDDVAVVGDDDLVMSFKELDVASDVLADALQLRGVVRDSSVGIYMGRCVGYVISYIAILKAGGAYMPLDVSYPDVLLEDIFEDSKPVCVITNPKTQKKVLDKGQTVIVLNENWKEKLESENKAAENGGARFIRPEVHLDDLAYIVYSSGTTGKPKGIMCPHRGAVFSYTWRHLICPFETGDRVACNVFFVWEMLRPLLKGIPLYVIPDTAIYDPLLLSKFLKKHLITRILFTPSLLETVLDAQNLSIGDFSTLKVIWFCGEVVTTSLLDRCNSKLPWVRFYNLYSISECHDVATSDLNEFLKKEDETQDTKKRKFAPVGSVCPGIHVVILDNEGNPQPVGMPGEIFVGGPTLARGYLNRPEMNEKRFVKRPDNVSPAVGDRLYRTGDWGLIRSDRNLEICGRCDSMVKIRGYSIEVQAVEAALMSLPNVNACVVLAVGDEGQDKQLVAYVVPEKNVTKKEIRDSLKTKLPFYMIPSYYIFLQGIPVLAASGKLDKKALPSIDSRRPSVSFLSEEHVEPVTDTEKFLEETWCEILQMEIIDVQESFFDLGGHSLLAARLLGKIRARFTDREVTMQHLFANPTIFEYAGYIHMLSLEINFNSDNINELDLNSEVQNNSVGHVNLDIQLRAFWRSLRFGGNLFRRGRVLLTGATGFLGAYLLKELLLHTKVKVYCLVRRLPDKTGEERLKENLEFYEACSLMSNIYFQAFNKRVSVLFGDVALVNLGLSEEDHAFLTYEIDYVIHAAAYVNLVYPYEALKGTNVTGTRNVLLFAQTGKIKPLHYISTNAVFPNNKVRVMCKEQPTTLEDAKDLRGGYSQTKWVAEQLLLKAIGQGLPITMYRIGNLSGDRTNAGWNPSDFILLVLRASLQTSSWPDVDWQIEMTPVDFVSRSIVRLSQNLQASVHKIFHIVQQEEITGRCLFDWLNTECGYNLKLVSMDEWCRNVEGIADTRLVPGHPEVRKMLENASLFSYNTTFDLMNFKAATSENYPSLNKALMRSYINKLTKRNVLSRPPRPMFNNSSYQIVYSQPLGGNVAVVTGASSGIGRSIAIHLASAGAKVCIAARSVDKLEELKSEIEKNGGVAALFKCDVTVREEVIQLVKYAETNLGPVDIMVNNAGVMMYTMMSNLMMDDWDKTIDVNCKGVTNGIGAVLTGMISRGRGHIVNMSSDAGLQGFAGLAVYSGTKFFVEGVSQALRHEMVGKGIKVTCIQPGDVKTNIQVNTTDMEARKQYDASENCKILDPDDIGRAVTYVVSQPDHVAINQLLIEPKEAPI